MTIDCNRLESMRMFPAQILRIFPFLLLFFFCANASLARAIRRDYKLPVLPSEAGLLDLSRRAATRGSTDNGGTLVVSLENASVPDNGTTVGGKAYENLISTILSLSHT